MENRKLIEKREEETHLPSSLFQPFSTHGEPNCSPRFFSFVYFLAAMLHRAEVRDDIIRYFFHVWPVSLPSSRWIKTTRSSSGALLTQTALRRGLLLLARACVHVGHAWAPDGEAMLP
jgi:hypothetical protein